jgi:hypothetical protein
MTRPPGQPSHPRAGYIPPLQSNRGRRHNGQASREQAHMKFAHILERLTTDL